MLTVSWSRSFTACTSWITMASMGYLLALHRPLNGVRVVLEKSSYAGTKRRKRPGEALYMQNYKKTHSHTLITQFLFT